MRCFFFIILAIYLSGIAISQTTWTKINDAYYAYDPRDIAIASNGTMYVIGGANRELLTSTNNGDSWTHLGMTNVYCVAVKPDSSQAVLIGVDSANGHYLVLRSETGGTGRWDSVLTLVKNGMMARASKITFSTANTSDVLVGDLGYSGTYGGTQYQLFKSTNGGVTFTGITSSTMKKKGNITDIEIDPTNSAIAYVTMDDPSTTDYGVFRSADAFTSSSWTAKNTGLGNKNIGAIAVDPSTDTRLYCCTKDNVSSDTLTVYVSTNSGSNWFQTTFYSSYSKKQIKGHSMRVFGGTIYIATSAGIWSSSTGVNPTYNKVTTTGLYDTYCQSLAVYSLSGNNYMFCGTAGAFYRSTNSGSNWAEKDYGMATFVPLSVSFMGSTLLEISSNTTNDPGALIVKSTDGGTDWFVVQGNLGLTSDSVLIAGDIAKGTGNTNLVSCALYGNINAQVLRSTDTLTWTSNAITSGTKAHQVLFVPGRNDTCYLAGATASNGAVFKSIDGGVTWNSTSLSGVSITEAMAVAIDNVTHSNVYVAGTGGIAKSTDRGSTWSSTSSTNTACLAIDPNNTSTIYTGGTGATTLCIHPMNSNSQGLYQAGVNGTPFLTKAGYDESAGLPIGWRVNRTVMDPNNIYTVYVATNVGLYKKTHQWYGNLEVNTTWTSGSDIQIGNSNLAGTKHGLRINSGDTLTVQAGATVKFLTSGSLGYQGYLNSVGTLGNVIHYQPLDTVNGYWDGISGPLQLQYCDVLRGGGSSVSGSENYYALSVSSGSSTCQNCTVRECSYGGIGFGGSASVPLKHDRVTGINVHAVVGIATSSSQSMDSCYVSGCVSGLYIANACSPGFHADTIEANGQSTFTSDTTFCCGILIAYISGVPSPRFGGWSGTEGGYNVIRNNGNTQIYLFSGTKPFFGNSTSGGYNRIYSENYVTLVKASLTSSGDTMIAEKNYWGMSPPPSRFFNVGSYILDTTNSLSYHGMTLLSPPNDSTGINTGGLNFYWNNLSGASTYDIQVATDSNFISIYHWWYGIPNGAKLINFDDWYPSTTYYWRMRANGSWGNGDWSPVWQFTTGLYKLSAKQGPNIPRKFSLAQNYPNPFNPVTIVNYSLPKDSYVTLKLYNILGEEVATPVNGFQAAGYKQARIDGSTLGSGIYFYRLQAGNFVDIKKMILMK